MTKPLHNICTLLPLAFITWWSSTLGFHPSSHNQATYQSMSAGVSYSSINTDKDEPTVANNQSNQPEDQKEKALTPDIGLPQDVSKSSTTHTAIADNTVITITDEASQTQDTENISRDKKR